MSAPTRMLCTPKALDFDALRKHLDDDHGLRESVLTDLEGSDLDTEKIDLDADRKPSYFSNASDLGYLLEFHAEDHELYPEGGGSVDKHWHHGMHNQMPASAPSAGTQSQ